MSFKHLRSLIENNDLFGLLGRSDTSFKKLIVGQYTYEFKALVETEQLALG